MIHPDKEYLMICQQKIEEKIVNQFKLQVNINKTEIKNIKEGFDFLGYRFRVIDNKTIINLRGKSIRNMKKRLKKIRNNYQNNNIKLSQYFSSINNYLYGFKYGSYNRRKRIIDKCIKDITL